MVFRRLGDPDFTAHCPAIARALFWQNAEIAIEEFEEFDAGERQEESGSALQQGAEMGTASFRLHVPYLQQARRNFLRKTEARSGITAWISVRRPMCWISPPHLTAPGGMMLYSPELPWRNVERPRKLSMKAMSAFSKPEIPTGRASRNGSRWETSGKKWSGMAGSIRSR